jgi:hypothetical protein
MNAAGEVGVDSASGTRCQELSAPPGTQAGCVPSPVTVRGVSGAIELNAGGFVHACARTATSVLCWGDNTFGTLGNGTTTSGSAPVAVAF